MSRPGIHSQLSVTAALFCLLLLPNDAQAQNPAAAEALFEQARAAMAAGSYDIACARFRDSDKLDPAVGTRFNLADCEEKRGRVATAWSLFRGVSSELAADDDRRPIADERAAKLKPRLPVVTLVPPPNAAPGMRVRIDGVEIGEGSFGVPLPMDPGKHELSVMAAGEAEQRTSFELLEGVHTSVPLSVQTAPPPPPKDAGPSVAPAAPPEADSASSRRQWAYVAGGVGAAGIVVGAVAGIITLQKKGVVDDNCSDSERTCNQKGHDANKSGRRFGVLSGVGFGVGVVGLAAGAYLLLTSPPAASQAVTSRGDGGRGRGRGPSSREGTYPSLPGSLLTKLQPELALEHESGFVSLAGRF